MAQRFSPHINLAFLVRLVLLTLFCTVLLMPPTNVDA